MTAVVTRRMTLREAADALGISKEAVRKRVIRGTLRSEKGSDGRVYVYLDAGDDEPTTHEPAYAEELISEMRDRIAFLEGELQRKDAILLNMTEAMKAISPPAQEESSEPQEAPVTATEEEMRGEPATGGSMAEGAQRPWWRRWLGG